MQRSYLIRFLFVVAFVMSGCVAISPEEQVAPPAVVESQAFPSGTFDEEPYLGQLLDTQVTKRFAYTFNEDGTFSVNGHGLAFASGKAEVTGNQVTLVANFLDGSCTEEGKYSWSFDGTKLNFTLIEDPCDDRRAALAGGLTKRVTVANAPVAIEKLKDLGTTKSLTVLPLIDVQGIDSLKTEFGVAYLVKTDDATILLDVGRNTANEDPSPLMANMEELGVNVSDVDAIVITHQHFDHTGGVKWQFADTFSLGNEQVDLGDIRAYVPTPMTYPGLTPVFAEQPMAIANGVALIGTLPMTPPGFGNEQVLAVNVEGKGIVLITGCGHPTIPKIVERAQMVFDEPVIGIVGGLHYPEKDMAVVQPRIDFIQGLGLQLLAVSPHDSSEEAIAAIRDVMPDAAQQIKVGQPITFGS